MGQIAEMKIRVKFDCDVSQIGFHELKAKIYEILDAGLRDDNDCEFHNSVLSVKVKAIKVFGFSPQPGLFDQENKQ